ncbi:uncharacterized protein LOC143197358 [Rhynchophorus ferrugineus]|uniref:uncharacterized protein LOC143197358 n=1 Tax=Rhynchophorus ferrugineus TaxID=354439 RepID=UPI003FCDBCF2
MSDNTSDTNLYIKYMRTKDLQNLLTQKESIILEQDSRSDLDSDDSDNMVTELRTLVRDIRKELHNRSRQALAVPEAGTSRDSSTYSVNRTPDEIEIDSDEMTSRRSYEVASELSEPEPEATLSKKKKDLINRYLKYLDERQRLEDMGNQPRPLNFYETNTQEDRLTTSVRYFEEIVLELDSDDSEEELISSRPSSTRHPNTQRSEDSEKFENKLITLHRRTRSCDF